MQGANKTMGKTQEYELEIYSPGIVHCSVCTNAPPEELITMVNEHNPTGLNHGWRISDDPFRDGSPNPNQCEDKLGNKHYLIVC